MANGLKYGNSVVSSVMLDAPVVSSRYNLAQWTLNSAQPSGGITVSENTITITKFKPNVPILTSNFTGTGTGETPTSSELCVVSKLIKCKISGFNANPGFFTDCAIANVRRSWSNVYLKGLWFGPYFCTNDTVLPVAVDVSKVDGAVITYSDSTTEEVASDLILRGTGNGYGRFYHITDKEDTLTPDWVNFPPPTNATNANWQLAVILFTGYTPAQDGTITLDFPIRISISTTEPVNPTSIEAYKAYYYEDCFFDKAKTFANTLMKHCLASKQVGTYEYPVQGLFPSIVSSTVEDGQQVAYPAGAGFFDSRARFLLQDTGGTRTIFVNGFNYLESINWVPGALQIAVGNTITICGKLIGCASGADMVYTVQGGGAVYAINSTTSILGNPHTLPGNPGNAGTLSEPYTVTNACVYAGTLGEGVESPVVYITGKITSVLSRFSPSYSAYTELRYPNVTDLGTLISNSYPIKFWCTQYDDTPDYPGFWAAVKNAFANNAITDPLFANHLFTNAGGNGGEISLAFNLGYDERGDENYADITSLFDYCNAFEGVYFTLTTGKIKSLVNVFRCSQTIMAVSFSKMIYVSSWAGAFEGAAMYNFPYNLAPLNEWGGDRLSSPTCDIHCAADGSALNVFGEFKDQTAQTLDGKYYTLIVRPGCWGAFRTESLSEIKYLLDMRFVTPEWGDIVDPDAPASINYNAMLHAPNLTVANISGLNKGDWYLDGQTGSGIVPAGNLEEFDEDSANFLLENLFDLRRNTTETDFFENEVNSFNDWTATNGGKTPIAFGTTISGATLSRTLTTAKDIVLDIRLSNCTLSVTTGGSTSTLTAGNNQTIHLSNGLCTFSVAVIDSEEAMTASLELPESFHFRSELTRNLTSANIYLPADWETRDIIHASAVQSANTKGWTVYVGGNEYTITP